MTFTGWNTPFGTTIAHRFYRTQERSLCGGYWSWGPRSPLPGEDACDECANA